MKKILLGLLTLSISLNSLAQCWSKLGGGGDYFVAMKSDGTLWTWGNNTYGQLGNGTTSGNFPTPAQVGTLNTWSKISGGDQHILAIKNDGTLWAWGYNFWGQLGNLSSTNQNTPFQVGTDNDWLQAVAGGNNSFALKTNGKIYAWGHNGYGQMGNGTVSSNPVLVAPTQVGTDSNWAQIAGGSGHCMAIKTDGTLWGWGYNTTGQVGVNTNTNVTVPTQVGTANDWAKVFCGDAHTLALKNDGTLWSWGTNNYGQLGNGNTTSQLAPVLIDSMHTWSSIAGGASHTLAITTTGNLFVFGYNGYGQLGNGTSANSGISTLTQIGNGFSWSLAGAGWYFSEAMRTDGTLWGWGKNNNGQTGISVSGANVLTPSIVVTSGCNPTETGTLPSHAISIYPNPTSGSHQLIISSDDPIQEIVIMNLTGQITFKQTGQNKLIDISRMKEGVYTIQVITTSGRIVEKIILN